MLKTKIFAIIIFILLSLTILFFSLSNVYAEDGEIKGPITIQANKKSQVKIETIDGELKWDWSIIENNVNISFSIFTEDEIKFDELDSNKSSNKINVTKGEYTFEWLNKNNRSVTIDYTITYPKEEPEEDRGCYSAMITSSILFIGLIVIITGFSKKIK